MARITVRKRDMAAKEVVRVERITAPAPAPDLSPLETSLRAMEADVAALRAAALRKPLVNYEFEVRRGDGGRIESVTARAVEATALTRGITT